MKEFKSFYKKVGGGEGEKCHYPTRLDTYGRGCSHDCRYCYAKSLLNFRKLWNPVDPGVADIKKIENVIKRQPAGTVLRLGGMTDCFQPCELKYRTTLETIKLLNKYGVGYLIVTKSHIVANDEYLEVLDTNLAHIQVTVTTLDDRLSLSYENASVPGKRIDAIRRLQDAGHDVAVRLSPLVPEFMDFEKLNGLGIEKSIVEFLRVNSWIEKWFNIDYSGYTLKEGGYRHLPLETKKELLSRITIPSVSVCDDVMEHYEYWRDNVNPNKNDCCNLKINGK